MKALRRCAYEFASLHGIRTLDALEKMARFSQCMKGKRLRYETLTA